MTAGSNEVVQYHRVEVTFVNGDCVCVAEETDHMAAIRIIANATTGEFGSVAPDTVPAMLLLKHWEKRRGGDASNT